MRPSFISILIACCFAGPAVAQVGGDSDAANGQADTLVLCPVELQPALADWLGWRRRQGHQLQVLSPAPIAAGIKQQIRTVASQNPLATVVIVGDAVDLQHPAQQQVATDYVRAKVNVCFGSDPTIATDSPYADLNDDGLPDVAIGRIPVDSVQQLQTFTRRLIAYESSAEGDLASAAWRRRINFVAGIGGFGKVVDAVVEQTTKQIITDLIPADYETTMTYGSWSSPYCPDPRRFAATAIHRFNEGALFWVYVGHGNRRQLDYVRMPDQLHPILDVNTARFLSSQQGSPIAIFLACFTGATDDAQDGLAETMLLQPRGPIAAIAGTRVTMPYAMSLLSVEMLDEYFAGDSQTLGQVVQLAKRRMVAAPPSDDRYRKLIDSMGRSLSPLPALLKAERLEHVQLIHLLGDPLLRIKRPQSIAIQTSEVVTGGELMTVFGESPAEGQLQLELVYDRDRFLTRPKRRRDYVPSDAAFREYQNVYDGANTRTVWTKRFTVPAGSFRAEIPVPASASGRCQVRAVIAADGTFAMGSQPVRVKKLSAVRQAKKATAVSK